MEEFKENEFITESPTSIIMNTRTRGYMSEKKISLLSNLTEDQEKILDFVLQNIYILKLPSEMDQNQKINITMQCLSNIIDLLSSLQSEMLTLLEEHRLSCIIDYLPIPQLRNLTIDVLEKLIYPDINEFQIQILNSCMNQAFIANLSSILTSPQQNLHKKILNIISNFMSVSIVFRDQFLTSKSYVDAVQAVSKSFPKNCLNLYISILNGPGLSDEIGGTILRYAISVALYGKKSRFHKLLDIFERFTETTVNYAMLLILEDNLIDQFTIIVENSKMRYQFKSLSILCNLAQYPEFFSDFKRYRTLDAIAIFLNTPKNDDRIIYATKFYANMMKKLQNPDDVAFVSSKIQMIPFHVLLNSKSFIMKKKSLEILSIAVKFIENEILVNVLNPEVIDSCCEMFSQEDPEIVDNILVIFTTLLSSLNGNVDIQREVAAKLKESIDLDEVKEFASDYEDLFNRICALEDQVVEILPEE